MTSLMVQSGLAIDLDPLTGSLTFGNELNVEIETTRSIGDLESVLAFPDAAAGRESVIAYRMYRGIARAEDVETWSNAGLRYDVTVTLPGDIGSEYFKTSGHMHSTAPDGVGYPEIYDVLFGKGMFVVQWDDPLRLTIVQVRTGDRVLIPPGVSHVTANTGSEPLVIADVVPVDSRNNYDILQNRHGAAIYLLQDPEATEQVRQQINAMYPTVPTWQTIEGSRMGAFPPQVGSLYETFIKTPTDFEFLTSPAAYAADMAAIWSERRAAG